MNIFQQKIEEVINHFNKNDLHLGFRRMVDCALETQDILVYKQCIELNEWKENSSHSNFWFAIPSIVKLKKPGLVEPTSE